MNFLTVIVKKPRMPHSCWTGQLVSIIMLTGVTPLTTRDYDARCSDAAGDGDRGRPARWDGNDPAVGTNCAGDQGPGGLEPAHADAVRAEGAERHRGRRLP